MRANRPVEVGSPETHKIPLQKIEYISKACRDLPIQGKWISETTIRQSIILKNFP